MMEDWAALDQHPRPALASSRAKEVVRGLVCRAPREMWKGHGMQVIAEITPTP